MSRRTNRRRNEKKQNVASANGRGRKPTSSLEGFRSEVLPLHHRVLQHAQSWLQHCTRYWQLCQVPESLHTKIGVNKGESEGDVPQQTDSVSDTLDSHEAAFDCKN